MWGNLSLTLPPVPIGRTLLETNFTPILHFTCIPIYTSIEILFIPRWRSYLVLNDTSR